MAFQQFRLGELSLHTSITPHIPAPYGSGDSDDGYTLTFPNLAAFQAWREEEEERNTVEFVKGDTHGSKAVPPRFKDHTKLVCARHSRSGRKKYVKKHPERVRKVPSRKLDGVGCPASISYKTYYDTEEVRACYVSSHSHEIGPANLPFTRKGRKAALATEKDKRAKSAGPSGSPSSSSLANAVPPVTSPASVPPPDPSPNQIMSSPPSIQAAIQQQQQQQPQAQPQPPPQQQQVQQQHPQQHMQQPVQQVMQNPNPAPMQQQSFSSAVSMLAPLPTQQAYQAPQAYGYPAQQVYPTQAQDRWENMSSLFSSIREHARSFEYPLASVAALETVLIRLYLESPMGVGTPAINLGTMVQLRQNGQGQAGDGGHPGGTS